jgi:hypothetical protein
MYCEICGENAILYRVTRWKRVLGIFDIKRHGMYESKVCIKCISNRAWHWIDNKHFINVETIKETPEKKEIPYHLRHGDVH